MLQISISKIFARVLIQFDISVGRFLNFQWEEKDLNGNYFLSDEMFVSNLRIKNIDFCNEWESLNGGLLFIFVNIRERFP